VSAPRPSDLPAPPGPRARPHPPGQAPRRPPARFEPREHAEALAALATELLALPGDAPIEARALDRLLRRHPRAGRGLFSRSELVAGLRDLGARGALGLDRDAAEALVARVRRRPVRSHSGVTPVTVLTRPHPCPGRCLFCPNDVRMPKSYLSDEPGAQRAADNHFDPYLQTWNRLAACHATGHATDKVELIVLGGTWSSYPEAYRVAFVTRCLEALNDFRRRGEAHRAAGDRMPGPDWRSLPPRLDGRASARGGLYNAAVSDLLRRSGASEPGAPRPRADWRALARVQRANESAAARCVGLSLETRPDHLDDCEVAGLRRLGATKVQVGVQSLSDAVLAANRRGHDVEASRAALHRLRRAGFKLHVHWMPNLLGATPESDLADARRLFADPGLRPDELKIYPCSLVESAELMQAWEEGRWRPYDEQTLLRVVAGALAAVPRWCRVTRVIRDISSDDIVAGNRLTNLRELAEARLRRQGCPPVDVRAREVRSGPVDPARLRLRAAGYASRTGREEFLEWVDHRDRIAGFARLTLPEGPPPAELAGELAGAALLREVHVYGSALSLGERGGGAAQHRGLGRALVGEAARRARDAGFGSLAVISALGTRPWYRRLGFRDGPLYQHRPLG